MSMPSQFARAWPNIERSAFRRGEYVGYSGNMTWIIKRASGSWHASCVDRTNTYRALQGRTLTELSVKLADYEARPITMDDMASAARGLSMHSMAPVQLAQLIAQHEPNPLFASRVIVAAARLVMAGRT